MSFYRTQLEVYLKNLNVRADRVLDIGGAQNPIKGRTKTWDVKEYKILDLPEYDVQRYSQAVHLSKTFQADMIFCLEVFEYLIQPIKALKSIKQLLKRDGVAIITFQFIYPHHEELEADSLRFTETGVKKLCRLVGLKILKIHYRIDKSGLLEAFYSADGMRRSKNYDHHNVTGFIVEVCR